jgi:hypothetical protein
MTKIEDGIFKCPFCGIETPVEQSPIPESLEQLLLTDEEINTTEMPCDEDTRECPLNTEYAYEPTNLNCQLCSHRQTAKAQLQKVQPLLNALKQENEGLRKQIKEWLIASTPNLNK